ncbi:MAG TPA: hypothetical protein VLS94_12860, partial [Fusibacter sp.]|nr:hypothetical protein [Fusibacter sp.]
MFKNYNMNQLVLPLDLEIRLQENDIAFTVHHLVESIPDDAFEPFIRTTVTAIFVRIIRSSVS